MLSTHSGGQIFVRAQPLAAPSVNFMTTFSQSAHSSSIEPFWPGGGEEGGRST